MARLLADTKAESPLQKVHEVEVAGLVRQALHGLAGLPGWYGRHRKGVHAATIGWPWRQIEDVDDLSR